MNFIIQLVKKIENILDMSNKFDNLFSTIIDIKSSDKNINNIYSITSLYILIRAEHGGIIILNDKMKMEISKRDNILNDETINKLYDLSTFTSIIENINNLVSNIDFEYKKIAIMFPKLIDKKQIDIILFTNSLDKKDKYIKIIEDAKQIRNYYNYHVVECEKEGVVINCNKILNKDISIKVANLPSMYLINDNNISELPIKTINNADNLIKLID